MINFFKKPAGIVSVIILILAVIGGYLFLDKEKESPYEFIVAKKGDFLQQVSVTGKVKPAETVDLAFEKVGRVSGAYVEVGDRVSIGQLLVSMDNSGIFAKLQESEANLKSEQAKLDELRAGTREEEIQIQKVKFQNAATALSEAKKNLTDKLQDAYTKSDDAVRNKSDQLFNGAQTSNPQIKFSVLDSNLKTAVEIARINIESTLGEWLASLGLLSVASDLDFYTTEAKSNLGEVKSFLDNLALAVNPLNASSKFSQTIIDGWKKDVSTARTNVNTAVINLSAAENKFKTEQSDLSLAEQELILKQAGATKFEIKIQEANVEKAEAAVQNIKVDLSKTRLYSPISGIVTKQDAKKGEVISANAILVTVISGGPAAGWKIEANIPEVDIAKLTLGDEAEVTLDAYGDDVIFTARLVSVDPAETIIEGVSTYKVSLNFSALGENNGRAKSGMTANINIITNKRENIISVPARAVITDPPAGGGGGGGDKFVRIVEDISFRKQKVLTGLRDSFGNIEITEGINEGDRIIIFIKQK